MPKSLVRTDVLSTRVTQSEKRALAKLANRSELSLSDYTQAIIQKAIEEGTVFNGRRTVG